jgi:hypothetical protein
MPANTRSQLKIPRLEEFPLNKLPMELRRMIWYFTLSSQTHYVSSRETSSQIKSPPLPVALLVNRVSRETAQRYLSRFPRRGETCPGENAPYGYFNPKLDFLHIDNASTLRSNRWLGNLAFPHISIGYTSFPYNIPSASMAKGLSSYGSKVFFCESSNVISLSGHKSCKAVRLISKPEPREDRDIDGAATSKYRFRDGAWESAESPDVHWVSGMLLCCACPSAYRRAQCWIATL